jgi:hypothetical protein
MEPDRAAEYRAAFAAWLAQAQRLHAVLLDGEPLDPLHRVALLRRESQLHDRYEAARRRFFNLPDENESSSPFAK